MAFHPNCKPQLKFHKHVRSAHLKLFSSDAVLLFSMGGSKAIGDSKSAARTAQEEGVTVQDNSKSSSQTSNEGRQNFNELR